LPGRVHFFSRVGGATFGYFARSACHFFASSGLFVAVDRRSFPAGRRRGGRGRFKLDQGLRFLVGQPQDEVVSIGPAGQRVLVLSRKPPHFGDGLGRPLPSVGLLALPKRTHRPVERRRAGHVGMVFSETRRGEQRCISGRVMAAAVLGHAQGHLVVRQVIRLLPKFHRTPGENDRGLVGPGIGWPQAAQLGCAICCRRVFCVLGRLECPRADGGHFLVLAVPRQESAT